MKENTPIKILTIVCSYFNVKPKEAFNRSRKKEYVKVRHYFFYLASKHTNTPFDKIGRISEKYGISRYHHATVMHAKKVLEGLLEVEDKETINDINEIELMIMNKSRFVYKEDYDSKIKECEDLKMEIQRISVEGYDESEKKIVGIFRKLNNERKNILLKKAQTDLKIQYKMEPIAF